MSVTSVPQVVSKPGQLGHLLVQRGLISEDQLATALTAQAENRRPLGRVLIEQGLLTEENLVCALAEQSGYEYVDLTEQVPDASVFSMLSPALARRYQAIPLGWEGERLVVAMADPRNVLAVDDIRTHTGKTLKVVVASAASVAAAIDRFESLDGDADRISAEAAQNLEDETDDASELQYVVEDAPIVKLVNLLI